MKIAVIGGGPSGLAVTKYCLANQYDCDVFEQRDHLGGTWNLEKSAESEDGNRTYSYVYEGLFTHIPKETMTYPDHLYPSEVIKSFLEPIEISKYLKSYADKFNIHQCMKYSTIVEDVTPNISKIWKITFKNLKTKLTESALYDIVFICNGHVWYPFIPKIPGQNVFEGRQIHSRDYYTSASYKDKDILVIGAGPSARDIVELISPVAKQVYVSYQGTSIVNFRSNTSAKVPVAKVKAYSVVFEDGSEEKIDDIIYCTGYDYNFPFLSSECGITVEDKCVYPLYQHIVNINYPTMFFIGIPSVVCTFPLFDLQARFAMAVLKDQSILPTRTNMLKDLEEEMNNKKMLNIPKQNFHRLENFQKEYWKKLGEIASIAPPPHVLYKIFKHAKKERRLNMCYKIVDDENFEVYTVE